MRACHRSLLLIALCAQFATAGSLSGRAAAIHDVFEEQSPGDTFVWRGAGVRVEFGTAGRIRFEVAQSGTQVKTVSLMFRGAARSSHPAGDPGSDSGVARYYVSRREAPLERRIFGRLRYHDLYPGVDVVFFSEGGVLEYDLELAPHADPSVIRIEHPGVSLRVNAKGDLEAGSPVLLIQKRPLVYQVGDSGRVAVPCDYVLYSDGAAGFRLGGYDRGASLTIDPVLNFAVDIGSQGSEAAYAMVTDAAGAVYIAGETDSAAFTGTGRRTSSDAFVAKLKASGVGFDYLLFMGGNGRDAAKGIAVDASGNAYVTGTNGSSDFPVTQGASNAGLADVFVAKLGPTGSVIYAVTLGSTGSEEGNGIAVDTSGNAYVTGQTTSLAFPTTSGAFQRNYGGGISDCFVLKLNAAGTALLYSTYLGGSGLDLCRGIAIDSAANAYVTGTTYSTNFPVQTAFQSTLSGIADAFVTKLSASGSALVYSTFLGGSSSEDGNAIAVDSSGAAYVAGHTLSANFPVTTGVVQSLKNPDYDAFVSKLSPGGNTLAYSTFAGGSGGDSATAIAVDSRGRALIAGFTNSPDLPMNGAVQSSWRGSFDIFAAVLDSSGYQWLFSTYLGGSADDRAFAAAAGSSNRIYIAGVTQSLDFTGASGRQMGTGNSDIIVAQMTYDEPPAATTGFVPFPPCRVVDTRTDQGKTGAFGPPYLAGGVTRTIPMLSSPCGIPGSPIAYSLNITVLPRKPGVTWLTAWPAGQQQPTASTPFSSSIVANAAIVAAGTGGAINVVVTQDVDLIIDINGYFGTSSSPLAFYTLRPCRVVDTRTDQLKTGEFGPPKLAPYSSRIFTVPASPCAIPGSARAYSLNMTVVPVTTLDFLSSWPTGQPYPGVSTLNSPNGELLANAAIIPAGTNGAITAVAGQSTELIIDINGYFAPPGSAGALYFHPLPVCRVADTRVGQGKSGEFGPPRLEAYSSRTFTIPASGCGVPLEARAYSLNVSVIPPGPLDFLSMWPAGSGYPGVSTLNSPAGRTLANAAIVPSGTNGAVTVVTGKPTDLIIDINGYFAP
jgi:hypothetical protein